MGISPWLITPFCAAKMHPMPLLPHSSCSLCLWFDTWCKNKLDPLHACSIPVAFFWFCFVFGCNGKERVLVESWLERRNRDVLCCHGEEAHRVGFKASADVDAAERPILRLCPSSNSPIFSTEKKIGLNLWTPT